MKSSAWDNKLWHDKMLEIPLEGDIDSAWNNMQGMLDETMPVVHTNPVVKKLWGLSRSLVLTLIYTAAAAAIVVFSTHYVLKKTHNVAPKHHKQNGTRFNSRHDSTNQADKDSMLNNTPAKDTVTNDSTGADNTSPGGSANPAASSKNNIQQASAANAGNLTLHNAATAKLPVAPGNAALINAKGNTTVKGQGNVAGKAPQTQKMLTASSTGNPTSVTGHPGQRTNTLVQGATAQLIAQTQNTLVGSNTGSQASFTRRGRGRKNIMTQQGIVANTKTQSQNSLAGLNTGNQTHGTRKFGQSTYSVVNNTRVVSPAKITLSNAAHFQINDQKMLADASAFKSNGITGINPFSADQNDVISNVPANQGDAFSKQALSAAETSKKKTLQLPAIRLPRINLAQSQNYLQTYSKFELAIETGINAGKGSTTPYAGLSGSYAINHELSISIGGNMFSSRIISGGYTNANYKYTTEVDSPRSIHIINHTAKIIVSSSQKIYTLDIPVTATYRVNNWLSIKGGPVIGIPIKTGAISTTLAPVGTALDTARAYKILTAKVDSTMIPNKVNLGISGGVIINLNRLYFNAGYVQGISPYTISSAIGTGKVYYHTLQFGIGYRLFRSKPKHN